MRFSQASVSKPSVIFQFVSLVTSISAISFEAHCNGFGKSIKIPNVSVAFTNFVANGTNLTFPDSVGSFEPILVNYIDH